MREELGDLLLHVVMQSQIAEEEGIFNFNDVVDEVSKKMIRRHPHVFGDHKAEDKDRVIELWEDIKAEEIKEKTERKEKNDIKYKKSGDENNTIQIPNAFPALIKAEKLTKKMIRLKACSEEDIYSLAESAINELRSAEGSMENIGRPSQDKNMQGKLVGDLLFIIVKLAVQMGINAEESLDNLVKTLINDINRA